MKLKVVAIVVLLVVGGAALVVGTGVLPRNTAAATTYLTSPATVADVADDVAATGSIAASTSWSLAFGSAPTVGDAASSSSDSSSGASSPTGTWQVTAVKAKVGDTVTPGEVLATAANAELQQSITAAKNDLKAANIQLLTAQDAYDNATTTDALRQTRTQLLNAQNGYATAKQSLRDLQDEAARASLLAPAAGVVTAVNVTKGLDAPSGAAVTIDAATYQVTADVVESDISSIKLDQDAAVTVDSIGADLTGKVSSIAPTAASSSSSSSVVSYAVTIDVASPPKTLRSGMTADITITTASASNVLSVPAAAIRGTNGNYTVLVLVNGTPQAQPVQVGLMTSSLVEIKSGLNEGDEVVIGTSSQQRNGTTTNGFGGAGGFQVGGGGGGNFRGGANGPTTVVEGK
jgi:membrane fusion protein, macrolide-specific efflux system